MDGILENLLKKNDVIGIKNFLSRIDQVHPTYPDWDDYKFLRNILQKNHRDIAKLCIIKGFRVNERPVPNFQIPLDTEDSDDEELDFRLDKKEIYTSDTPLHVAVSLQDEELVLLLLNKGADTCKKGIDDETPLTLAAKVGNDKITDLILSRVPIHNHWNKDKFSHFQIACMRNNINIARKMLQAGANINSSVDKSFHWAGFTPLHFAVQFRCAETVKFLVHCGADITIKNKKGLTALLMAYGNYHYNLVDDILSVHHYFPMNPVDPENLSHFDIACSRNNLSIVQNFIQGKVEFEACDAFDSAIIYGCLDVFRFLCRHKIQNLSDSKLAEVIHLTRKKGDKEMENILMETIKNRNGNRDEPIESLDAVRYTALISAIYKNEPKNKIRELLQDHKTDIIKKDRRGKTPLHIAFYNDRMGIVDEMLKMHSEFGENPIDDNGLSHFHILCSRDNEEMIRHFLQKGVNFDAAVNQNSTFWPGFTPLHFATHFRRDKIAKLLLDVGVNFVKTNALGMTAFDIRATIFYEILRNGEIKKKTDWKVLKQLLLSNENKMQKFNSRGMTLLHMACAANDKQILSKEKLRIHETKNLRIDEDSPFWPGFTPLHFTIEYDSKDLVQYLLESGVDVSIKDARGITPAQSLISFWIRHSDKDWVKSPIVRNFYLRKITNDMTDEINSYILFFHYINTSNNDFVKLMLNLGMDVNKRCPAISYETLLHSAAKNSNCKCINLLLDRGADMNATDALLRTPLFYCRNVSVLKTLLDRGSDPQTKDWKLNTPAMILLENDYFGNSANGIKLFLEYGIDVNHENADGESLFTLMTEKDKCLIPMLEHIKKLDILKLFISSKNRKHFNECLTKIPSGKFDEKKFSLECFKEVEEMKRIKIDGIKTLFEVLTETSSAFDWERNVQAKLKAKAKILLLLSKDKFPIYWYLGKLDLNTQNNVRGMDETANNPKKMKIEIVLD